MVLLRRKPEKHKNTSIKMPVERNIYVDYNNNSRTNIKKNNSKCP